MSRALFCLFLLVSCFVVSRVISSFFLYPISLNLSFVFRRSLFFPSFFSGSRNISIVFGAQSAASALKTRFLTLFEDSSSSDHIPISFWTPSPSMADQCPLNVMNFGATPDQLISKTVNWCLDRSRQLFFLLVDTTDAYSVRLADEAQRYISSSKLGYVIGRNATTPEDTSEAYITIVRIIADTQSCVILNFLPSSSTAILLREMTNMYLSKSAFPVFSFFLTEKEMSSMELADVSETYLVSSYFTILPTISNSQFIKSIQRKYGNSYQTNRHMGTAYVMVQLWAQVC